MPSDTISRDAWKQHLDWRRSIAVGLPEIAQRVFALRGKSYAGCGGHYALERSLGQVITFASALDTKPSLSDAMIEPVIYDGLLETLANAEATVTE